VRAGKISTSSAEGARLRVESNRAGQDPTWLIFDGDAGKLWVVEPSKKEYLEMDRKSLKAFVEAMERLAEGQATSGKELPAVEIERTKEVKEVAGYRCEGYRRFLGGKLTSEGCVIPWEAASLTPNDFAVVHKKMVEFLRQGMSASPAMGKLLAGAFEQLDQLPGISGVEVEFDENGRPGPEARLVSIKRQKVDASMFVPPAGFTRKSVSLMLPPKHGAIPSLEDVLVTSSAEGLGDVLGSAPLPFGEAMTRPELISGRELQLTPEAKAQGVRGKVTAKCVITRTGEVTDCRIIKPLPFMESAVIDMLHSRRYKPVTYMGRTVSVDYIFSVDVAP
jgi:hypothetical protein